MVHQDGYVVSSVEDTDEVGDENGGEEQHMTNTTSSKGATRIRNCHSMLAQKRHSAPYKSSEGGKKALRVASGKRN